MSRNKQIDKLIWKHGHRIAGFQLALGLALVYTWFILFGVFFVCSAICTFIYYNYLDKELIHKHYTNKQMEESIDEKFEDEAYDVE